MEEEKEMNASGPSMPYGKLADLVGCCCREGKCEISTKAEPSRFPVTGWRVPGTGVSKDYFELGATGGSCRTQKIPLSNVGPRLWAPDQCCCYQIPEPERDNKCPKKWPGHGSVSYFTSGLKKPVDDDFCIGGTSSYEAWVMTLPEEDQRNMRGLDYHFDERYIAASANSRERYSPRLG
jgi:hypothetical protein